MASDIDNLRLAFCSLIIQAKGAVVANFVSWLDLKVAEFKVYGHMILSEELDHGNTAWQSSIPTDPDHWPRQHQSISGNVLNIRKEMHSSMSSHELLEQSRPMLVSNPHFVEGRSSQGQYELGFPHNLHGLTPARKRGRPLGNIKMYGARGRPLRPKTVAANLLRNAIIRSKNLAGVTDQSENSMSNLVSQHLKISLPHTVTRSEYEQLDDTHDREITTNEKLNSSTEDIKMDQRSDADMSAVKTEPESEEQSGLKLEVDRIESEDDNHILGESKSDNTSSWLPDSTGSAVFPGMPEFVSTDNHSPSSSGLIIATDSNKTTATSSLEVVSHSAIIKSSPQSIIPTTLVHSRSMSTTSPGSSAGHSKRPRGFTQSPIVPGLIPSLSPGGIPSKDSVNDLLNTHTVQTESGYLCKVCDGKVKNKHHMIRHMEKHLGVVYTCPICSATVARRDTLKEHVARHNNDTLKFRTFPAGAD